MWQLAASLWHDLSAAEQAVWERDGTARGMTGYAWWMSQALRPNPGIYLPLAGGTMSGDINMDAHRIEGLPEPLGPYSAAPKAYVDVAVAAATLAHGARVKRTTHLAIADSTYTPVTYESAEWDNDDCWDLLTWPTRLYCKTAGIYAVTTAVTYEANAAGRRMIYVAANDVDVIAVAEWDTPQLGPAALEIDTLWQLGVGDYLTTTVYQTSGGPLTLLAVAKYSPAFTFARIG